MVVVVNPYKSQTIAIATLKLQQHVLMRANEQLRKYQDSGQFPKSEDDYDSYLRQGGRTVKRDIGALPPQYLKFPNAISYVRKDISNTEELENMFVDWIRAFNAKAPVGKKEKKHPYKYKNSLMYFVNDNEVTAAQLMYSLTSGTFPPKGIIGILDYAPHASTIEDNWNGKGHLKGGVMYSVTRSIARKYPDMSIAYKYYLSDNIGLRYGKGTGGPTGQSVPYFLPLVTMGMPGLFTRAIIPPGNNRTRKRNRRRRRF